jgi:hypothetical protein
MIIAGLAVLGIVCFIQLMYIAHNHRRTIRRWLVPTGSGQQQQQQFDQELVEYDLMGFLEAHPPRRAIHLETSPVALNPLMAGVIPAEDVLAINIIDSQL